MIMRLLAAGLWLLVPLVGYAAGPQWIWAGGAGLEADQACFRADIQVPAGRLLAARLWITADNAYRVWLNGHLVGEGASWEQVDAYDLLPLLIPGHNLLAVAATNTGRERGVLATVRVVTEQQEVVVHSGRAWQAGRESPGWQAPGFAADQAWTPAVELGPPQVAPWRFDPGFGEWLSLRVSPPEITPNGDGLHDRAHISYSCRWQQAAGVRLEAVNARGEVVWSASYRAHTGQASWPGATPGRGVVPGSYRIRALMLAGERPAPAALAETSAPVRVRQVPALPPARYRLRPFFPIGVWFEGDPQWAGHPADPAGARAYYERSFADLQAHGFNCVAVPNCPESLWDTLLAAAARHGLKVVLEVKPLVGLVSGPPVGEQQAAEMVSQVVKRLRAHPALLRYQIRDEPPPEMMPNWLLVQRMLAAQDPTRPAFSCFNSPGSLAAARKQGTLAEAVFDIYPHGVGTPHQSLGHFVPALSAFLEAAGGLPAWAVLQSFAKPGAWRYPTPEELRAVTYLSLAAGAKGVFYFIYQSMPQHPERLEGLVDAAGQPTPHYAAAATLARELGRLSPLLLSLRPAGGLERNADYWVGRFLDGSRPVLIVASARPDQPVTARVRVGESGPWQEALSERVVEPVAGELALPLAPGEGKVLLLR